MWWHSMLLVWCLLTSVSQAFAPIYWMKTPSGGLSLTPKGFRGNTQEVSLPQELIVRQPDAHSSSMVPHFTAKADTTITWDETGWCVEAGGRTTGDAVRVSQCNGGAAQKWNWIPDGLGRYMIQLRESNQCLEVKEGGLNGAPIALQDCASQKTGAWKFEKSFHSPTQAPAQSFGSDMQHAMLTLLALFGVGLMGVGAWLWHPQNKAHIVTTCQGGMSLAVLEGDVPLTASVRRTGNISMITDGGVKSSNKIGHGHKSERFRDQPPVLSLLAPAKINLFLRIVRRRGDDEDYAGYHELASLFQTVSLFDTLSFWTEPPDENQPICSMEVTEDSLGREGIPTDESNLVIRALALFAERTGCKQRVHCQLHKEIPAQAGMGGGSSDAATALHAANRLAGFPVSQEELIAWGGELGSDVSFFLSRGTAYCTGRGEIIEGREPLSPCPIYLIKPAEGLSTPMVFRELGLQPGQSVDGPDPLQLLEDFEQPTGLSNRELYVNDLEPFAFLLMPKLRELRDDLAKFGFQAVMMSGSGTTIFSVGAPFDGVRDTWKDDLKSKYDVEVFEASFCGRVDDKLWYSEQP